MVIGTLASAALLAGCSSGTGDSTVGGEPTATESAATPQPTEPVDPAALVGSIAVEPEDLPPGFGPDVMQKGDEVEGQVTLDLCGASFASEALRTARHQVAYQRGDSSSPAYDPAADLSSVMSETVAYASGGAEQAMRELREAATSCPRGFTGSSIAGRERLRTRLTDIPAGKHWQSDHLAVVAEVGIESGESFQMALVYQRRGDLLAATYVMTSDEGRGTRVARRLASILGERLDAAPDAAFADPSA